MNLVNGKLESHVVLVHGIASPSWVMWPLEHRIRQEGFSTSRFGYASLLRDIEIHGANLRKELIRIHEHSATRVSIVAHSLGGIVTRRALTLDSKPLDFVDRVVLLGTPHHGSRQARWLAGATFGMIRTLRQLSDSQESYVNALPTLEKYQVGSVAASYDFVVSAESSHSSGEHGFSKTFSGHNGLLVRPKVAKLVIRFLQTGSFKEAP